MENVTEHDRLEYEISLSIRQELEMLFKGCSDDEKKGIELCLGKLDERIDKIPKDDRPILPDIKRDPILDQFINKNVKISIWEWFVNLADYSYEWRDMTVNIALEGTLSYDFSCRQYSVTGNAVITPNVDDYSDVEEDRQEYMCQYEKLLEKLGGAEIQDTFWFGRKNVFLLNGMFFQSEVHKKASTDIERHFEIENAVLVSDLCLRGNTLTAVGKALGFNREGYYIFTGAECGIDELTRLSYDKLTSTRGVGKGKTLCEIVYRVHDAGYSFDDEALNRIDKRTAKEGVMEKVLNELKVTEALSPIGAKVEELN
jgi:hypothetical protein